MTAEVNSHNVSHLLRDLAPQVLGALVRRDRNFADAEDAMQEALIAAATQWAEKGIPANPRGWLFQVAVRRLADYARSSSARRVREEIAANEMSNYNEPVYQLPGDAHTSGDDALILLFMCCHQSLTPPSAIALTLRAVGGLTTAEIARAFMVPEATMAQRISRAKQTILASGVAFSMPTNDERASRIHAVLHILYLMFSEGYTSSGGATLQRTDLSDEANRITRMLLAALPDDAEVVGLLALMLLTDARRCARTGVNGELIPLDEQDRSLWNSALIEQGRVLVTRALSGSAVGAYALQAAIAALHDEARTASETDWPQILALYEVLKRVTDNPMVALNHVIAESMVHGAERGLRQLELLEASGALKGHYRLDAVRAHFCVMLGDNRRAAVHFRLAAQKTMSVPERNYLTHKAAVAAQQTGEIP